MTTKPGRQPSHSSGAGEEITEAPTTAAGRSPAEGPDAIRADNEATRADLGDSVDALAAKSDVRTRAKETATAVTGRAKGTVQQVGRTVRNHRAPATGVVAAVVTVVGAVLVIRRRRPPMLVIRRRRPPMKARVRNRLRWR